jgi:hypothetical protein
LAGCGQSESPQGDASQRGEKEAGDLIVGEPIRHANLTIFPVSSRTPKTTNRFITLAAGLKAGTVEVMEVGARMAAAQPSTQQAVPRPAQPLAIEPLSPPQAAAPADPFASVPRATGNTVQTLDDVVLDSGPDVNHLLVLNRSDKPLYLMPGEIIIGGQQDRAVGREYVIAPSDKPAKIEVFCVEHGRWHDRVAMETVAIVEAASGNAAAADSIAFFGGNDEEPAKLAEQTASGKFIGSIGNVSKATRLAVQGEKNQGAVWAHVAATNGASGVSAPSGAFTANYAAPDTIRELEPYMQALSRPVAERPQIVGVLVAVNGHVESMDVFESTPLFLELWPKLLKSYALDAANAPPQNADKLCAQADAVQFLATATAAQSKTEGTDENLVVSSRDAEGVVCFSAHDRKAIDAAAATPAFGGMGGGMGGYFGGAVHTSGFSK